MQSFAIVPEGPFDLATARDFAGGFAPGLGETPPTWPGDASVRAARPTAGPAGDAERSRPTDVRGPGQPTPRGPGQPT